MPVAANSTDAQPTYTIQVNDVSIFHSLLFCISSDADIVRLNPSGSTVVRPVELPPVTVVREWSSL